MSFIVVCSRLFCDNRSGGVEFVKGEYFNTHNDGRRIWQRLASVEGIMLSIAKAAYNKRPDKRVSAAIVAKSFTLGSEASDILYLVEATCAINGLNKFIPNYLD